MAGTYGRLRWAGQVAIALALAGLILAATADASEQPQQCWLGYEDCARQAAGDPTWRSVCYADFSSCIGKEPLPACPASGSLDICTAYRADCRSFSGSDATLLGQCTDDYNACTFAHGC